VAPLIKEKRHRRHLDQATQHYGRARKGLDELAVGSPGRSCLGLIALRGAESSRHAGP